ncbi:MAG: hypothetical protein ACOX7N_01365 [Lawsonibacter sp.]|jgi:chromosome segregation ATPase
MAEDSSKKTNQNFEQATFEQKGPVFDEFTTKVDSKHIEVDCETQAETNRDKGQSVQNLEAHSETNHTDNPTPSLSSHFHRTQPTPGQRKRRQKSVFQYITILFAAAFLLLLYTFLMERRQNDLLQQQNQEQIDNLQQSVTAVQSLQNLYDQNESLQQQVADLEKQLGDAQNELENLNETMKTLEEQSESTQQAMDWFWQINEAYVRNRWSLCRQLINNLESANLVEFLPKESYTDNERFSPYDRYQEIYNAVF